MAEVSWPRVLVVGSGGLGAYLGGRLLQAGLDVTFRARSARAAELARGLRIASVHGDWFAPSPNVSSPGEALANGFDVVLLTVKTYDLDEAVEDAVPLAGPGAVFLPLQNGGEHVDRLARRLGPERVAPGVVYVESDWQDGAVRQTSPFQRVLAGPPAGREAAVSAVIEAWRSVGVKAEDSPDMRRELWLKWMLISPFAALTCLARADMAHAWADRELAGLGEALMDEFVSLAPVWSATLDAPTLEGQLQRLHQLGQGSMTSMARDLLAGRRLELDAIHRAVVRLGQVSGVPTPAHASVVRRLAPFEHPA